MGVEEILHQTIKQPQCRVLVGGIQIGALSIHLTPSFDSGMASADVELDPSYTATIMPSAVKDQCIEIYQGYNGLLTRTFKGYVVDVVRGRTPMSQKLVCKDEMFLPAQNYYVDEKTLDPTTPSSTRQCETVVGEFLTESGVAEQDLATSNFTLADAEPATFVYKSAVDCINEICALIGWRCWADNNGIVHFRYIEPVPSSSAVWQYTAPYSGLTLAAGQGVCLQVGHDRGLADLRNYVKVQGWNSSGSFVSIASAVSAYIPNPPGYWKCAVVSELIDTQPMADAIAARILADLNRLREKLTIKIEGNPLLNVGQTVSVTEPWTGNDATNYFIWGIDSSQGSGSYEMELTLVGGTPTTQSSSASPLATFEYTLEQEFYNGEVVYVLLLDASSSSTMSGSAIASYSWSDGATTKSGMYAKYIYTARADKTITLTVTDGQGNIGTISREIDMTSKSAPIKSRVLTLGCEDGVYTSLDGGCSWTFAALS